MRCLRLSRTPRVPHIKSSSKIRRIHRCNWNGCVPIRDFGRCGSRAITAPSPKDLKVIIGFGFGLATIKILTGNSRHEDNSCQFVKFLSKKFVFHPCSIRRARARRGRSAFAALRRDKRGPPLPKPFAPSPLARSRSDQRKSDNCSGGNHGQKNAGHIHQQR